MRRALIAFSILLGSINPAFAQISIDFGFSGVNIGINLPVYPTLQRVPGYPVYYAPGVNSNYFFYDGLYWVYQGDNWYASSWYNGPWAMVDPMDVPLYVLRVPVRYYRHAPAYFHGWRADDPPHWGDHWGESWQQHRSGWDQWKRGSAPAPAPLPTYQRQYSGNRYPQQLSQQAALQTQNYRYQPKDPVAQQHFQQLRTQAPAAQQQVAPRQEAARQPPPQHEQPRQQAAQPRQAPVAREQQAPPARVQAPVAREPQAPLAREQQVAKQPQPQREQQSHQQAAKPQQAPVAREQQRSKPQPQQQAEQKPQQGQVAHAVQAPKAQAQERQPHVREQAKEQGKPQAKERGNEKDKEK